jgi:hypothetical protein
MTNDDIIRMAREAGVANSWDINWFDPYYARFAKLVAAAEREACALAAEAVVPRHTECGNKIAGAIRARGQG